jgi:hypothetical protein
MLCINVITGNKKMYQPKQVRQHNEWHENIRIIQRETMAEERAGIPSTERSGTPLLAKHSIRNVMPGSVLLNHLDYYNAFAKGQGMSYLVRRQFHSNNKGDQKISIQDAQLHTLIAFVSLGQSKNENARFARLIQLIDIQNKQDMQELIEERNYYR